MALLFSGGKRMKTTAKKLKKMEEKIYILQEKIDDLLAEIYEVDELMGDRINENLKENR
jgi:hypothetical protein